MQEDWRLAGNERLFRNAVLTHKAYRAWSESWEHDHCSFCWVTFTEAGAGDDPASVSVGYAAPGPPGNPMADYYWVCEPCFEDFRELLNFTVSSDR